ncbi:hypothetical protein MUN81_19935 [Hymenobacter sp. 5317J-9]|uniref:hypothetical protein n=1 Tax=Hymenobacter sp. 5317J-9 TaxID=2932250 RepID=UPI001FD6BB57|nr:hypothetical protein [Hymenobacter sp. 5317J-9]UOQ97493.1 hypothetical protein MUN81_19935 [Hymenobacter sp. 5317J-9]
MATPRVPAWVWAVVTVLHALALGWALYFGSWDFPDSGRYRQAAENVQLHMELYAQPWPAHVPTGQAVQEFTIRPPGYPLVVLGLGGALGRPVALLVVQNLLSLLNVGLVLLWWARWAQPDNKSWAIAVFICLTFPAQFIYANTVMSEVLLQTVLLAMLLAALRFLKRGRIRHAVGVVMAIVLALLIKPVFYPFAFAMGGLGAIMAWRHRRLALAVLGFVPTMVVGLYMGWNEQRTGYFHFSSITDINLLHYNAAGVVRQVQGAEAEEIWVAGVLREANAQPNFALRQRVIQQRATAVLWAHPLVYARQHALGMVTFFVDPGRFDVSEFLQLAPLAGGGCWRKCEMAGCGGP